MKRKSLFIVILVFLMISCSKNAYNTSYPMPIKNTPSEYIFVSTEYLSNLIISKSHSRAIYLMQINKSPILFYQTDDNNYHESPNLHENGRGILIESKNTSVVFDGIEYKKYKVVNTIENTLGMIVIKETLIGGIYKNNKYYVIVSDDKIKINNENYSIVTDVGAGYNNLGKTMIIQDGSEGRKLYGIESRDNSLILIPLECSDGPVAERIGQDVVLIRSNK